LIFLDANCENGCSNCFSRDTSDNFFIESGDVYSVGCHYIENTGVQDAIAHSFTVAGSCSSDLSCKVEATPEDTSEVRGEEVEDSTKEITATVEEETSGALSEITEIAPIVEDPDACSFQLEYYGAANSITAICDDIIQNETNVIADGECNFDPLIGYYRAACSTNGGSKLIFLDANCENGCSNCFSRDTSDNFFIESGDVYSVGCHYIENTGVQDAIAHSFTVAGSCSSDLSCQVQSASETNTVAGAHTPNDLKNDSSGRSYTPSFANAVLCIAFWVYVAAFR